MNDQKFNLQPFAKANLLPNLKITGNINRQDNKLAIRYELLDNFTEVVLTPPSDIPARKHELWQDTCFEFFLGVKNSEQYWEFNLSPAGDWNIYRFDGYRQGMQEETAFTSLPFIVQQQSDTLTLILNIDLEKIVPTEQALNVAISTVIKHKNGEVTYWALTHRKAEADFHQRDSFIIEL